VAVFVIRRMIASLLILLASTFIVFVLVANSGDPLGDLKTDQSPNRAQKIAQRTADLHLDQSVPRRYVGWLEGVGKCVMPGQKCDLGTNRQHQDVTTLLDQAMGVTLRLVLVATLLAILIGVTFGIISAIRQYSGFDYTITFAAFVFFSLPIFWVSVLLKQYLAIRFNNWLWDPRISIPWLLGLSLASAVTWGALLGGDRRRRWTVRGIAFVLSALILEYMSLSKWFKTPSLGPVLVTLFCAGSAFGVTWLVAGLRHRSVLYASLASAGVGVVAQFALLPVLDSPSWSGLALLALVTVAVGIGLGYLLGGLDRAQAARAAALTGLLCGFWIMVDRTLDRVPHYSMQVNGRLMATISANTPNLNGNFYDFLIDDLTHLVLPTIAIMLISFATYTRYTRSTMLEVMNQDYIRTARAKGLTERTVIMRHGFRNALIPVTTLMAFDLGNVIAGAVITENVFGWQGMGSLFVHALTVTDPAPVMAFFIVTAASIVVFNMLADLAYAYLDPRIRLS